MQLNVEFKYEHNKSRTSDRIRKHKQQKASTNKNLSTYNTTNINNDFTNDVKAVYEITLLEKQGNKKYKICQKMYREDIATKKRYNHHYSHHSATRENLQGVDQGGSYVFKKSVRNMQSGFFFMLVVQLLLYYYSDIVSNRRSLVAGYNKKIIVYTVLCIAY